MKPAAFFQLWPPIPWSADITAVATHPGVDGGLLALSALEHSPLARVSMTGIPAMGGFQAAYIGALYTLAGTSHQQRATCVIRGLR